MPSHDRICRARCRLYPCAKPPDDVRHCLRYDLRVKDCAYPPTWEELTRAQRREVRRMLRRRLRDMERDIPNWGPPTQRILRTEIAAFRAALGVLRP